MHSSKNGFSLFEMMAVLMVMAVLASLVMPAVGRLRAEAERMQQANQVREVALLWQTVSATLNVSQRTLAHNLAEWLEFAARSGNLHDPSLFIVPDDPAILGRVLPETLLLETGKQERQGLVLNPEVLDFPFSYVVISHVPRGIRHGHIPIVWTRGLQRTGEWQWADGTEHGGVFATGGGWIAFLDGSVRYFDNLHDNGGELRDFRTGARTHDILRALPPGTRILGIPGLSLDQPARSN